MDPNFIPGRNNQQIKVAIVDNDTTYIQDMIKHYNRNTDFIKITYWCDSLADLLEFLVSNGAEIVIISWQYVQNHADWYQRIIAAGALKVIIMTDQLGMLERINLPHEEVDLLYKYTPLEIYTRKILSFTPKGKEKDVFTIANPASKEQQHKKMALFYSPKGGVGTTTTAVNAGCQLALKDHKVLLVDFAVFGHISLAFNLPQRSKGLSEVISYLEQGKENKEGLLEVIQDSIQTVAVQGKEISILSAGKPLKMTSLSVKQTDTIIQALQQLDYDVMIWDTSSDLSERNVALLSAATDLFFILTTDIAANWSLLSAVEIVRKINQPFQNKYLIINAYHESIGFPITELESVLSMKVSAVVPHKYEQVQGYANRGMILAEKPFLKLNKHYRSIANFIKPVFKKAELAKRNGLSRGVRM